MLEKMVEGLEPGVRSSPSYGRLIAVTAHARVQLGREASYGPRRRGAVVQRIVVRNRPALGRASYLLRIAIDFRPPSPHIRGDSVESVCLLGRLTIC